MNTPTTKPLENLASRWESLITDDDRIIANPEATKRSGVLERNRLMTVNQVRREMLNEFRAILSALSLVPPQGKPSRHGQGEKKGGAL